MARYAVDGAGVPLPWRGCGEDGAWWVWCGGMDGAPAESIRGGAGAEVGVDVALSVDVATFSAIFAHDK